MFSDASWLSQVSAAQNLLVYFVDTKHRDHVDKIIGPLLQVGLPPGESPLEALLAHFAKCNAKNQKIRRGRKIKRQAQHSIIRTPDDADMSDEEARWFQHEVIKRMEWDFAFSVSHRDKCTRATDFHFLSPYRKGRTNPIAQLRAVSDELHLELNRMRKERDAPRIDTMAEVRHRRRREAGIKSLSEQLADLTDFDPAELRAHVEGLGHTVTRHNEEKGTVSVIHKGKKKAHRYLIEALQAETEALRSLRSVAFPVSLPDVTL